MSNYMGLTPKLMTTEPAVAAVEAHGESSAGLPQFDPTWWPSQILWLVLCFAVLYFFFSRSALPRLSGILESRRQRIESDMKAAEQFSAQAEEIKLQYEQALKTASLAASDTIRTIDDAAREKLAGALADFRQRYDEQISETETRLGKAAATAMAEMNGIAAEIAAQAAEKIAGIPADQSQAESVVRSLSQKNKAA
jgi:F-type H+-transporting ATPase subunit b